MGWLSIAARRQLGILRRFESIDGAGECVDETGGGVLASRVFAFFVDV